MKMSPIMRRTYKIYEAFKDELIDSETAPEFEGARSRLVKKIRELYIRHRDSNDLKPERAEKVREDMMAAWQLAIEDLAKAWQLAIEDLAKADPITHQTLRETDLDFGG